MIDNSVLTVAQVANALNKDKATIRYLIEHGLVPWGISFRREGNKRRSYIIYKDKFTADTGIVL